MQTDRHSWVQSAESGKESSDQNAFGISKYFKEGSSLDPNRKAKEEQLAQSEVKSTKRYELLRTPSPERESDDKTVEKALQLANKSKYWSVWLDSNMSSTLCLHTCSCESALFDLISPIKSLSNIWIFYLKTISTNLLLSGVLPSTGVTNFNMLRQQQMIRHFLLCYPLNKESNWLSQVKKYFDHFRSFSFCDKRQSLSISSQTTVLKRGTFIEYRVDCLATKVRVSWSKHPIHLLFETSNHILLFILSLSLPEYPQKWMPIKKTAQLCLQAVLFLPVH